MKKILLIIFLKSLSLYAANTIYYYSNESMDFCNFTCCSDTKGTNSQSLFSCCSDAIGSNADTSCSCCSFAEGDGASAVCSCCSVAEGRKSQVYLSMCNNSFGTKAEANLGCCSRATGNGTVALCGFCNFSTDEDARSYCGFFNHSNGKESCTAGCFNYVVERSHVYCCFNYGLVPKTELGLSCCSLATDSPRYELTTPLCCPCPKIVNEGGAKPICFPSRSDCRTMCPPKKAEYEVVSRPSTCSSCCKKKENKNASKPKDKKSSRCCGKKGAANAQAGTEGEGQKQESPEERNSDHQERASESKEAPEAQQMKEEEL